MMKTNFRISKLIYLSALSIALCTFSTKAQQDVKTIDMKKQDQLKKEGKETGKEKFINFDSKGNSGMRISNPTPGLQSLSCNCWIPRDTSFHICHFDGSGGNGGPGIPPHYENDDWSTNIITLPFNLCFYGVPTNQVYINNNGNVSIGAPYSTFTANSFPDPTFVMIAPFWGDVDTRGIGSGFVWYKMTPTYLVVQWDSVGYFGTHVDKLNTFQLIISNGADPIISNGNNVSFCYKDMQWTTGDASSGVNGFGGTPATVGVNQGNGTDYIQIGLFDQAGSAYDGPYGNNDGIDALDNQSFQFNICVNGTTNIPPIINSVQICDTIRLCVGDTFDISANYLSPEQGQITTPGFNANGMQGITTLTSTTGNQASIVVRVIAQSSNIGCNTIFLTGTDNGIPNQTTSSPIVICVQPSANESFNFVPATPQTPGTPIQFYNTTTGATVCTWDFGDGSPTTTVTNPVHAYANDGTYIVTLACVNANGCRDTLRETIKTRLPILIPNVITPNGDAKNDSLYFKHLEDYPNSRIEIYNRWGNKIYENSDYKNDWEAPGQSDGTYYFILHVNEGEGKETIAKGYFEVLSNKK